MDGRRRQAIFLGGLVAFSLSSLASVWLDIEFGLDFRCEDRDVEVFRWGNSLTGLAGGLSIALMSLAAPARIPRWLAVALGLLGVALGLGTVWFARSAVDAHIAYCEHLL